MPKALVSQSGDASSSRGRHRVALGSTDMARLLLAKLSASAASIVPSPWHPADTLPQWIAWMLVILCIWFNAFVINRKPDAIRQEEERKRKHILAMSERARALNAPTRPATNPHARSISHPQ